MSQLQSKGGSGGRYRYLDPSTSPGSWIYRVQDCDNTGAKVTFKINRSFFRLNLHS